MELSRKTKSAINNLRRKTMIELVQPTYEILEESFLPFSRCEKVGRVCRGEASESKMTQDSWQKFCLSCKEKGHNSVFGFGQLCLRGKNSIASDEYWLLRSEKYLDVDYSINNELVITGTIRAFIDFDNKLRHSFLGRSIQLALREKMPWFFRGRGMSADEASRAERYHGDYDGREPIKFTFGNPSWPRRHYTVLFVISRNIANQLVRHANGVNHMQESQRYCPYDKKLKIVSSLWYESLSNEAQEEYLARCEAIHGWYKQDRKNGASPQQARDILPGGTATKLYTSGSIENWRHILDLRTGPWADPEMRRVMIPLAEELRRAFLL
jgi:thymidylate synthase (FAD)